MRFKWYGTATLLLESGNTRLLIDPYLKEYSPVAPVPLAEARTAEAIFITHPHLDHFQDVDAFSEGVRPVYVSATGISHAKKNGLNAACMHRIKAGDEVRIGPFTVRVFPARHCVFDAATILGVVFSLRTWLHAGDCIALLKAAKRFRIDKSNVLAFEISDGGKSVMVFGSAGMDRRVSYPQGADLLFFPYQGRARMDREMLPFLDALKPKAVTIDHFDDAFPPITHRINAKRFVPAVKKRLPEASAFVPEENVWYDV